MKRQIGRVFAIGAAVLFLSVTVMELNAHARGGGSRSMGSRGSRTYTKPAAPGMQPKQQQRQQQAAPAPGQAQQPQAGGGFLRSMAGGIMGGMLGSMLFSSFAGAGTGGMGGGGGMGLLPIILLAGAGYFLYRYMQRKRAESMQPATGFQGGQQPLEVLRAEPAAYQALEASGAEVDSGLSHIRQMDPGFSEAAFNDTVMDRFFKIQAAWMNRDLSSVSGMLTDEMRRIFQGDIDQLLKDGRVNRLENIAVRKVEIAEAWQESGQDYITTLIHANLLDYTTDESSGAVVEGSKTEPVRFEEFWTFTRPVGSGGWQLSAIHQK